MQDIERIERALKDANLPSWVERMKIEPMTDHSGDPAVRVTLIVRDEHPEVFKDGAALNRVARQVFLAIEDAGVDRWPYTGFVIAHEAA